MIKNDDTVEFKIIEGEIIAIFPGNIWSMDDDGNPQYTSYMHVGQHGGCSPELLSELPTATPEQAEPLRLELVGIGYSIESPKHV